MRIREVEIFFPFSKELSDISKYWAKILFRKKKPSSIYPSTNTKNNNNNNRRGKAKKPQKDERAKGSETFSHFRENSLVFKIRH